MGFIVTILGIQVTIIGIYASFKYLKFIYKNTDWDSYQSARNDYIRKNTHRYNGEYRLGPNMPIPHDFLRVPFTISNLIEA